MSLAEKFPNATARPWILSPPEVTDVENANLIIHAVNTYDAREEALLEAMAFIRSHGPCKDCPEEEEAVAKIEAVLGDRAAKVAAVAEDAKGGVE